MGKPPIIPSPFSLTPEAARRIISGFVKEHRVPISYIDIYHADGMWGMPGEMCTRSYHPYKHGYGKLMHSGYHFLDLLMWLNSINEIHVPHKAGQDFEIYCRKFGAQDLV